MIILNLKKINSKFNNIELNMSNLLKIYTETCNFGLLECPNCGSTNHIKWGTYERNVFFFNNNSISISSFILTVQRIRCKSCGKTHALLPFGIIPYKQFSDEIISKAILLSFNHDIDLISSLLLIDANLISKWIIQFKTKFLPKISTMIKCHSIKKATNIFVNDNLKKLNFIIVNGLCFMQIKLGCLGLSPS